MITTRNELKEYITQDKLALGRTKHYPPLNDLIWRYEIVLRKCEYYENNRAWFNYFARLFLRIRRHRLGVKLGYTIPLNVCGKGLCIAHIGEIVISEHASIGDYCRIHVGVNIGSDARISDSAPTIGNYCYIAPGAKLFGNIIIGNNVAIGANAVVNKSFPNDCTIAGVPAKIISNQGTENIIKRYCEED